MNKSVREANKNFTIFIAEDNILQSQVLEDLLTSSGYEVEKAYDGEEAMRKVIKNPPDLILLDVMMPKLNGYEICKALRKNKLTQLIPIIIITTLNKLKDHVVAIELGADDFLTKPINEILLVARIKSLLKVKVLNDEIAAYAQILEQKVKERTAQLEETKNVTVFSLAKLANYRDGETNDKRLERIMNYSKLLAEELSSTPKYKRILNEEYVETIYTSSVLYDVGKVGISDEILVKPGQLNHEEFEIMKKHTVIGGDALQAAEKKLKGKSFLKVAKEMAYYHHERFNGNGYPFGLKEDKIPISARIMALADVYDAMTSMRVYNNVASHDETVKTITLESGKHFDQDVVGVFLNVENEFFKIQKNLYN